MSNAITREEAEALIAAHAAAEDGCRGRVDEHHRTLFGNHRPGLKSIVEGHDAAIVAHGKSLDGLESSAKEADARLDEHAATLAIHGGALERIEWIGARMMWGIVTAAGGVLAVVAILVLRMLLDYLATPTGRDALDQSLSMLR